MIPNGVNGDQVRKLMLEDFGIEIGTSFGPLHGKVWRIGTMGYNARKDCVMQTLNALEAVLNYLRFTTTQGAAMQAARSLPHRGHPMSDTVRQQAERGGRQPGDGPRRSAGRPQRNRRCPDPGLSVARASAGQPAGGAVDAGCRHDGVAGQRRQHLRTL